MKLTKIWPLSPTQTQYLNDVAAKACLSFGIITLVALGIWFYGANFAWGNAFPLAPIEKRIDIILVIYALWMLKLLLIDLDIPNPFQYKDPETRKKLDAMHKRFLGAMQFLKKTNVTRGTETQPLSALPSFLLIGPVRGGKTSLLANANVHFILQRQFQKKNLQNLPPTENCDWWVTRELSIIDVPGKYISAKGFAKNFKIYPILWRFFLKLMRKTTHKNAIKGTILALPLPEIMKANEGTKYQLFLNDLFQRLLELQKLFPNAMNCQIVITKCDLIPGFTEFFAESNTEEANQAWGISLLDKKPEAKLIDVFRHRFDAIIKKLNQQLIWRIHQERNPLARPYIKDFPLQIERLKETLGEFIKQCSAQAPNLRLQGIYLTSAQQIKAEPELNIIDGSTSSERGLQLFRPPQPLTRPYFIKQFIALGLQNERTTTIVMKSKWRQRSAIAASIAAIILVGYILGHDFQLGIEQAYSVQNRISDYHVTLVRAKDPDEQLMKTVELLDSLQQIAKSNQFKFDLKHLLSFYSYKSQQKATQIYKQALQSILLPELRGYIGQYLKNPVNKNSDKVYSAFKAYLMLGDPAHMQADYMMNTMREIAPKNMTAAQKQTLCEHVGVAFSQAWRAQHLDKTTIKDTRRYLAAIPSFDLSYIILKTYNDNNIETGIDLGVDNKGAAIFLMDGSIKGLPIMFTAKNFAAIYSQQTSTAATEATTGNWVLGDTLGISIKPANPANIIEQLRNSYVNNYVDTWEDLIEAIHLIKADNLKQTDEIIASLISDNSPLLRLLQTIHDNTYFEPLVSASPKLQEVGALVEKNVASQQKLYQLFSVLRSLHSYLQTIENSSNEPKAAFEAVSKRMKNQAEPDVIMQLRIVANQSPEPVKGWLLSVADNTWHYLMQDASRYINTSWENEVVKPYRAAIANRYPFSRSTDREVDLTQFVNFFGNPGVLLNFYNTYLAAFVDTRPADWNWKSLDKTTLPFSVVTLRQIQLGLRIHHAFFPNDDNKMYIQFAIQPHKFGENVKSVKLNINDKTFTDTDTTTSPHIASWPTTGHVKMAAVQLQLSEHEPISHTYLGDWAWFKLVNKHVENLMNKKELLLNFSKDNPAQYILFTQGPINPFLSLNLNRLKLPEQLFAPNGEVTKDA